MGQYLVKRLLFFIPTLIVISVIAFFLRQSAPGDPVNLYHQGGLGELATDPAETQRIYQETRSLLGLDKPPFYFSLQAKAYPDTLYKVWKKERRQAIRSLIKNQGNWNALQEAYRASHHLEYQLSVQQDSFSAAIYQAQRFNLRSLTTITSIEKLQQRVTEISADVRKNGLVSAPFQQFENAWDIFFTQPQKAKLFIPSWHWYGHDNQYHHWLSGMLKGDFGRSYRDGQPAEKKIKQALKWTLFINMIAILIAYGLSIPLGVSMAIHKDSRYDQITTIVLFILYSLPSFWIGTLLLILFTSPEYGLQFFSITRINETIGQGNFWQQLTSTIKQITLPVFCLVYGSLAFIARQVRGGMLEVVNQDYIRTAMAKGLPQRKVIWKHAFRNALFPLITLFASLFPALLAGSVVIEFIFNIPGMGKLTVDSIQNQDWPVGYVLLLLSALLTMAGILLADILYAVADPRVSYQQEKVT